MANHQIHIHVDVDSYGNANFCYSPALLRVYPNDGDTVTWTCSQGPFAVIFRDGSPCDQMSTQGNGSESRTWGSEPLTTRGDARGTFHYCVAVSFGGAVYIDASCPVLVAN